MKYLINISYTQWDVNSFSPGLCFMPVMHVAVEPIKRESNKREWGKNESTGEHGRTMFAYVSEGGAASESLATVLGPRAASSCSGGTSDEAWLRDL